MFKHYSSIDYLTFFNNYNTCSLPSVNLCVTVLIYFIPFTIQSIEFLFDVVQFKKIINFIGRPKVQPSCKEREEKNQSKEANIYNSSCNILSDHLASNKKNRNERISQS